MKKTSLLLALGLTAVLQTAFSQNSNQRPAKAEAPFLGVSTDDYPELEEGVLVQGVYKGYGAAAAGLQRGDILLAVNGDDVNSTRELTKELRAYKAGDEVEVSYLRFNKKMTAKAKLSEKPKYTSNLSIVRRDEADGKPRNGKKAFMGIYPQTDWQAGGVRVTGFTSKSLAWRAGLEEGDIITRLDDADISTYEQLNNYLWEKEPGSTMKVTFLRNGKEKTIDMTLGETTASSEGYNFNFDFGNGNNGCGSLGDLGNLERLGEGTEELAERMEELGERIGNRSAEWAEDLSRRAEDWGRDFERGWERGERNRRPGRAGSEGPDFSGGSYFSLSGFEATPNPTTGNVTISFSGKSNQPFSVAITNEDGREVAREDRDELPEGLFTQQFDLSREAAGTYYCRVYKGDNVIASQKIEKK